MAPSGWMPTVRPDWTAAEPADTGTFTLTATPAPAGPITVNYTLSGRAVNGVDYVQLPGAVAMSASTATVVVTPIDDALGEGVESVTLTLAAGTGYNVGTTSGVTANIAASDLPTASVVATDPDAAEAAVANTGTFLFSISNPTSGTTTITYAVSGPATPGTDYPALSGSIGIGAGSTSATVTVTPVDDALSEGTESVTVTITAAAAYTIGAQNAATVSIVDNDSTNAAPVITVGATGQDVVLP